MGRIYKSLIMKSTILYYTNNLLSKRLFKYTLNKVIKHAERNNCQLVICSHFPVFDEYENIDIKEIEKRDNYFKEFNAETGKYESKISPLYDYVNRETINKPKNIKSINIVTGKLPYNAHSIFYQILYSLNVATGNYIFLMEHDCLYHEKYISTILDLNKKFNKKISFTKNSLFMNTEGYFKIENSIALSGISGEKEFLKEIIGNKLNIYKNKIDFFEPIFDFHAASYIEKGVDIYKFKEIIIDSHICTDDHLPNSILDIKHGLNSGGNFGEINKNYHNNHEYWGYHIKYLCLIEDVKVGTKMKFGTFSMEY